ncbi:MAG: hypothetical protein JWN34_5760, partial [Bryobacterales bacterium]|nr:hypothetical protein [Bryobacterales bacterium]
MNLAAGRIRMVFIADVIPPDLRRVVDFLASQLRTAEVFAVEVRKYENAGHEAFVPRLVSTPKSAPLTNTQRQWDEATFFAELATRPAPEAQIARDILNAMLPRLPKVFYGSGTTAGSCIPGRPLGKDVYFYEFALWTN